MAHPGIPGEGPPSAPGAGSHGSQRRRLLALLALAAGALALGFTAYHALEGMTERALASGSAVAAAAGLGVSLRLSRSYRPALALATLYGAGITLALLRSGDFPAGDLLWCFLVPPLVAYAGGRGLARWLLPLYFLAAAAVVLAPGFPRRDLWLELELHSRFLGLLALTSVMAWLYESVRARAQARLEAEVAERAAAQAELALANRRLAEAAEQARRLARQAEAASEAKTRFLSQMSHDIRTPLTGILGMADLLDLTPLDPGQREHLRTIRTSGEALNEIIGGILDLARIESGRLEPRQVPVPLGPFLEDVRRVVEPLASRKSLELLTELDPALPAEVLGDPAQLRQILLNLAGNAVKFTPRGSVRIRFLAPAGDGPPRWRMEVVDTGVGIAPDQHRRIFERFHQVDPSQAGRPGGFGLGLAICARLAEVLGGEVTLQSVPGQGSTFRVDLPLAVSDAPRRDLLDRAARRVPPGPLGVLVVDDSDTVRRVVSSLLARAGHAVSEAQDGPAALSWLASQPVDVVLMDVQMPGMDGLEAVRRIRRGEGGVRRPDVPVVAVTAFADAETRRRCLEAGMCEVVTKPVDTAALEAALALAVAGPDLRGRGPEDPSAAGWGPRTS